MSAQRLNLAERDVDFSSYGYTHDSSPMVFPALQSCDDCGDGGSRAEAQGEMLGRNNAKLY